MLRAAPQRHCVYAVRKSRERTKTPHIEPGVFCKHAYANYAIVNHCKRPCGWLTLPSIKTLLLGIGWLQRAQKSDMRRLTPR